MNEYYDAIIVGTGAAGLYCALNLPKRKKILMLTKQGADLSDSFLAQGGLNIRQRDTSADERPPQKVG